MSTKRQSNPASETSINFGAALLLGFVALMGCLSIGQMHDVSERVNRLDQRQWRAETGTQATILVRTF